MPHLCVFGGTGPSGQCVIEEALSRNYTLTIFARTPSKLPETIRSSPSVTIIKGTLSDRNAISQAIHGADAVLSTLGPTLSVGTAIDGLKNHGTPLTDGYKVIMEVMKQEGVKRLIALGTVSNQSEQDGKSIVTWGMVSAVWVFLHSAWNDVVELGKAIQASEGIEWTIARVAKLTSGNGGNVAAGYIGKSGLCLARKDLGKWYLDEFENGKWIYQTPVVYST
jgi:putative NADH-flavin reductase